MRYEKVKNQELINAVKKKYELIDKTVELQKKQEEIKDKALAINLELGETKNIINSLMKDEIASLNLGEFEEEGTTEIKDGEVVFAVIDKLENAKKALRADKENRDRIERGEFTEAELLDQKKVKFLGMIQALQEKNVSNEDMDSLLDNLINVLK